MANIDIERKRGTNTWVWVVVALVVVAILAWLLWPRGEATLQQQPGVGSQVEMQELHAGSPAIPLARLAA